MSYQKYQKIKNKYDSSLTPKDLVLKTIKHNQDFTDYYKRYEKINKYYKNKKIDPTMDTWNPEDKFNNNH